MASKKAMLQYLQKVPLFSSLTTKDLEKIAKAGDTLTLPAGQMIIDQGQTGREAFVIINGEATVRRNGKKITTVGAGAVLGELSLLDHGPRTATVTCDTPCEVIVIDQRHFSAVLSDVPALSQKIMANLAARIREFDRQYYG